MSLKLRPSLEDKIMRKFKIIIPIVGIISVAVGFRIYRILHPVKEEIGETPKILVEVEKVKRGTIRSTVEYSGELRGYNQVDVYSEVPGRLVKYTHEEGDWVRKNETIAILDRAITGLEYKEVKVKAPISGTIGYLYLDRGMSIAVGVPIAMIVELSKVKVRLRIPEVVLPKLKLGMLSEVRVAAYPEEKFKGKVTRLSPVLDPFSKMALCEIVVDNPERKLKPGMLARVEIVLDQAVDIPVIPEEAVVERGGKHYVFKVENSVVHMVPVVLGLYESGLYELKESGIKEGDLIVTEGSMGLDEGFRVEYETEEK